MTTLRNLAASFLGNASGFTSIQAASTFAVAGIVGALVVAPLMSTQKLPRFATLPGAGIDMTSTGSIAPATVGTTSMGTDAGRSMKTTYRVRRSVLRKDMRKPCVLFDSGRREGNC